MARVLSYRCIVRDKLGRIVSSGFSDELLDELRELTSKSQALRAFLSDLWSLRLGEKRRIELSAQQAYGFYDPQYVVDVPRRFFDPNDMPEVGSTVVIDSGDGRTHSFLVSSLTGKHVTLDGNHPLAGQDLVVEVEAEEATIESRDTPEDPPTHEPLLN